MFNLSPYVCRVEWGIRGARNAAERGDIIIIVDVLSFSSTVISAVNYGAIIYPAIQKKILSYLTEGCDTSISKIAFLLFS
ncbi:hypothetical protein KHA94_21735 [Bacillus sp. FJAT-49705]|uniref:2-phosphosulfolactate phosphatase n=1 Tax=Cytobacillus citreus TaxID=2833586 RepID=A0ABS5NYS6_9BACI|nr:hypothetical protein [Cytobacillus citreus]MBS4192756.1 hypothetical protein [Cytobacillus citreus]